MKTDSAVHLVVLPNHGGVEKESMNFPYYLYRISLHYKVGDTILCFDCPAFARYAKGEKHTWTIVETALQEDCEEWLSSFSKVCVLETGQEYSHLVPGVIPSLCFYT